MIKGSIQEEDITIINIYAPNQKTKTGRMETETRPLHMLSTRDQPQNKGHKETESEGLEKKYFVELETKRKQESQYSYQIK